MWIGLLILISIGNDSGTVDLRKGLREVVVAQKSTRWVTGFVDCTNECFSEVLIFFTFIVKIHKE